MFDDRTDAGRQLAAVLRERGVEADLVLAVPRGGIPVGRVVADSLGAPLDVVVARKLGAPGNPELAIGAVASDGTTWLDDSLIDGLEVGQAAVDEVLAVETPQPFGSVGQFFRSFEQVSDAAARSSLGSES
jgi:predicted phosphoribosyltransferase